jgi:predicted enzyme related to lactoylglutathione lyase
LVTYHYLSIPPVGNSSAQKPRDDLLERKELNMNQGIGTIIYPVKDINRAREMFNRLLDAEPYADMPYYVGYKVGNQDIGLDPNGFNQGMTGPICYYHVSDIRKSLQNLLEGGAQKLQDIKDVGGGKLIATVIGSDGNIIGLLQMP